MKPMIKFNGLALFTTLFIVIYLISLQSISSPSSFIDEVIYHIQPYDTKGYLKAGIYASAYFSGLVAIILLILVRNRIIASLAIFYLVICYCVDILIQLIGNSEKGLSEGLFAMAMAEKGRANDMLMFKTQLIQVSLFAVLLLFFILLIRLYYCRKVRVNTGISLVFMLLAFLLSLGSIRAVYSIVAQSYPAPIKTLVIAFEYALSSRTSNLPRVLDEKVVNTDTPSVKKIVWIMDESIGGQYLSVNGFEKDTTPYLRKFTNERSTDVINYGVVPSISNCSGSSNLLLRIGLTNAYQDNITNKINTLPTIFQYAQRAGFKTTLIDAQVAKGQIQNHMTISDLAHIDEHITFNRSFIPKQRDNQLSHKLIDILNKPSEVPHFIFVVKWGAHWPYPLTYSEEVFKPSAKDSYTEFNDNNRELVFNSYFNSLRYSTDDFIKNLTHKISLEESIIFYTADHGQNLYKNKDPLTHCYQGETPRMDEYKVPLIAFSNNIHSILKKPRNKNSSQEQLFATTLELMGYDNKILQRYGPTLNEGSPQNQPIKVNLLKTGKRFIYQP